MCETVVSGLAPCAHVGGRTGAKSGERTDRLSTIGGVRATRKEAENSEALVQAAQAIGFC